MKKPFLIAILTTLIFLMSGSRDVHAEDKLSQMGEIRSAFLELQQYLVSQESFESPAARSKVLKILSDLRDNFHSVGNFQGRVSKEPGFASNVSIISTLLSDVVERYKDGATAYAFWRIRSISSNCISCHAQYRLSTLYSGDETLLGLGHFEKGEYFLATRQLPKAINEIKAALEAPSDSEKVMASLRRLLLAFIRLSTPPKEAAAYFESVAQRVRLPLADREELDKWIAALKNWAEEKPKAYDPVAKASELVAGALVKEDDFYFDLDKVALLRAVSLLHPALSGGLSEKKRSKALLLLGYSYAKLSPYYINELPEIYLEQCILEFPGTDDAKRAFQIYKDKLILDYSGVSGDRLPDEVSLRIKELHDKAFGLPGLLADAKS